MTQILWGTLFHTASCFATNMLRKGHLNTCLQALLKFVDKMIAWTQDAIRCIKHGFLLLLAAGCRVCDDPTVVHCRSLHFWFHCEQIFCGLVGNCVWFCLRGDLRGFLGNSLCLNMREHQAGLIF